MSYSITDFENEIKVVAEKEKDKLTEKVYNFLTDFTITSFYSEDAFDEYEDSPKDYFITIAGKEVGAEFYIPYQGEVECDDDYFSDKEVDQIHDVFIKAQFFYVNE